MTDIDGLIVSDGEQNGTRVVLHTKSSTVIKYVNTTDADAALVAARRVVEADGASVVGYGTNAWAVEPT